MYKRKFEEAARQRASRQEKARANYARKRSEFISELSKECGRFFDDETERNEKCKRKRAYFMARFLRQ